MAASESSPEPAPEKLRRRFDRLAASLGKTRWILFGTLHERRIPRPGARGAVAKRYGPYYQWTFKQEGRTVTVNLSASQVRPFRRAIERQRKLEAILGEMRSVSRKYLDATTHGVPKRKRRL
jgi:hypothetical protein